MSDLHPHALTLDDTPLQEGEVTATALRDNINALRTPDYILHLRCSAPLEMDPSVLVETGFVQVGITKLIDITLPVVDLPETTNLTCQWHRPQDAADWPTWYQAHWNSYRRTHPINIAKDPGSVRYPAIFGGADLQEALFAYNGDHLAGFASLRSGQEIGWIDTTTHDPGPLTSILAATLRRATAHGWTHATLEVDDDHPALWTAADAYADHPQQQFIMWQRSVV